MFSTESDSPESRRRDTLAYRAFLLAMIVCVLYTGLWLMAAKYGDAYAARALASEAARGRRWSCGAAGISGFPFMLRLTCPQPALATVSEHGNSEFHAAGMTAGISIFAPTHVDIQFTAPLTAKLNNGDTFNLAATQVMAVVAGSMTAPEDALASLEIMAEAPVVAVTRANGQGQSGKAQQARLRLARVAGAEAASHDIRIDFEGLEQPLLQSLAPTAGPSDVHLVGLIGHFELPGQGSLGERLERWRAAGGHFSIAQATLVNSAFRIEAEGPLGLDGAHRLEGRLALKVQGADALLQRFGLSSRMLEVGSTLGALFSGKPKPAEDAAIDAKSANSLSLALTFRDGKVGAGPLPLPLELLPLY